MVAIGGVLFMRIKAYIWFSKSKFNKFLKTLKGKIIPLINVLSALEEIVAYAEERQNFGFVV